MVFDASLRAAHILRESNQDVKIQLDLDLEHTNKKIFRFFPSLEKESKLQFSLKSLRPWEEAKVSVG
ncbi:MAG: hypothetical protein WCG98_01750 [bacterium]